MAKNTLCIAEYQSFGVDEICEVLCRPEGDNLKDTSALPQYDKNIKKAEKIFNELKAFAQNEGNYLFLKFKNSKTLVAQNYVGLIQTQSGFCVEILPKTFRTTKENEGFEIYSCLCQNGLPRKPCGLSRNDGEKAQNENNFCHTEGDKPEVSQSNEVQNSHKIAQKCPICQAKNLLFAMLKSLKHSPFKQSHLSTLKTQNLPLLDIFVLMFLDECESLVKRGIRANYVLQEQNRTFLKGKLLFNENLKHNLTHKERFFTASDEFSQDIAQNRLIKSTLELLAKMPLQSATQNKLNQMRFIFADITESRHIDKDLAKCINSRHFTSYELILLWCKLFLKKQSFMSYQGSSKAFVLLFDMNVLFESYVASEMKKWQNSAEFREKNKPKYESFMLEIFKSDLDSINPESYFLKAQEKGKILAYDKNNEKNKFYIKPDIVGYKENSQNSQGNSNKTPLFIADTKWKILNESESKNFGISQSDVYQIWAYLSAYQCQRGFLIYPKLKEKNENENIEVINDKDKLTQSPKIQEFQFKIEQEFTLSILFFPLENSK